MRKSILLSVVLSLIVLTSFHHTYAQAGFGLKAGVNLTNLKIDDPEYSLDSRTGYHAGVFLRGRFDKVAIQPEVLLFTQQNTIKGSFGTIDNSFTYLSVPVLLKFYLISGLNIQAGPQFGFLIDGEQKYETVLFTGKRDITESYKKSDIAASVGGGFDFPFGLTVDVRYNLGIKDINNAANGEETKSRVFLVSLGWNFLR